MTLELPDDSPVRDLPWIITFGPLGDDEEWEPLVCGPYERPHALALAEAVVADEDLMAVVEPLLPSVSADDIRGEIAAAKLAAEEQSAVDDEGGYDDFEALTDSAVLADATVLDGVGSDLIVADGEQPEEPTQAPSPDELRAGFARIATLLTSRP